MSEYLNSDVSPNLASSANNDVSRTSYTISSGIVGSSLKRPRTLLEGRALSLVRLLFEVALALLGGRSSESDGVDRTEENGVSPFRPVWHSSQDTVARKCRRGWHSPSPLGESEVPEVDMISWSAVLFDEKSSRRAIYVVMYRSEKKK